jgi:hypothetical protein
MAIKYWNQLTLDQRVERWENVLRVLRALTPHQRKKHWDMGDWGRKTECGTVACAAGHCGLDPYFRRRGFRLDFVRQEAGGEVWSESSMPVRPEDFFGYAGYDTIFTSPGLRTVSEVIVAVKEHIKELKKEAADEAA